LLITSLYWLEKKTFKFILVKLKVATCSITIMYLIFDTETTGLPKRWDAPLLIQITGHVVFKSWQLHDEMGNLIEHQDYLVKPDGLIFL
jgi:DNA polymerase-3 subunit alpha